MAIEFVRAEVIRGEDHARRPRCSQCPFSPARRSHRAGCWRRCI